MHTKLFLEIYIYVYMHFVDEHYIPSKRMEVAHTFGYMGFFNSIYKQLKLETIDHFLAWKTYCSEMPPMIKLWMNKNIEKLIGMPKRFLFWP